MLMTKFPDLYFIISGELLRRKEIFLLELWGGQFERLSWLDSIPVSDCNCITKSSEKLQGVTNIKSIRGILKPAH